MISTCWYLVIIILLRTVWYFLQDKVQAALSDEPEKLSLWLPGVQDNVGQLWDWPDLTWFIITFLDGFNKDDLVYVWKEDGPLTVHTVLPQTDFGLTGNRTQSVPVTTSTATYSTLEVVLNMKRSSSFCVLTQFVPLAMLVITSLISLWIPTDYTVKIGINVLLLMSVSFKAENINNGLPYSNYTKEPTITNVDISLLFNIWPTQAIDTWSGCSVFFIFISFILAAFCPAPEDEDQGCRLAGLRSWSLSGKVGFIARFVS